MTLNREKLAEFLGCSLRTIDEYKRQGMPGEKVGNLWKYQSSAVVTWLRDRERENALGEVAKVDESEARRRKLAAEAALAEHELAVKTGAAVSLADFEAAHAAIIGAARAKFLGIGAALGPEYEPVVMPLIKEALRELSEQTPSISFESDGEGESATGSGEVVAPMGTSPGSDGEPVGR